MTELFYVACLQIDYICIQSNNALRIIQIHSTCALFTYWLYIFNIKPSNILIND